MQLKQHKFITGAIQLLVIFFQINAFSESAQYVQAAKSKILREISHDINVRPLLRNELHSLSNVQNIMPRRSSSSSSASIGHSKQRRPERFLFSRWTAWTKCNKYCKRYRERYCRAWKTCGTTKHIEEQLCPPYACYHRGELRASQQSSYDGDSHGSSEKDIFIVNKRPKNLKSKKNHKKIVIELDDYENEEELNKFKNLYEEDEILYHVPYKNRRKKPQRYRNYHHSNFDRRKRPRELKKKNFWRRSSSELGTVNFDEIDDKSNSNSKMESDIYDINNGSLHQPYLNEEFDGNADTDLKKILSNWHRKVKMAPIYRFNSDYTSENTQTLNQFDELPFPDTTSGLFSSFNHNHRYSFDDKPIDPMNITSSTSFDTQLEESLSRSFQSNYSNFVDNLFGQGPLFNSNFTTSTTTTVAPFLNDYRKYGKEKAVFDMPGRYRRVYSKWSKWSKCSTKCTTRRFKRCRNKFICGIEIIREVAFCYTEGSFCQTWINGQVKINSDYQQANKQPNSIKPYHESPDSRRDHSTNLVNNELYSPGLGKHRTNTNVDQFNMYRPAEYIPQNLTCGLPNVRNKPKFTPWGMLKIIGGKTARKGQWPWQVAILNKFKEAFCGGTLISPLWILTAAHCVRKRLFIRLGEHNLEVVDGFEIEYRIELSIKHPNYDKRTVDNDVAILKLPKEVQPSFFIGFACLPKSYQELPKNHQCTIIGWGKRKNSDETGTNILHEAEVPIISNEECKQVYYDYTITKNMFCAGHKRGRIDTCAGDSGGPLLCRDRTLINQPWTIFGITSFGDGCGKRNKFGIYAKLPNYIDWIWSVVNCNGNCNSSSQIA